MKTNSNIANNGSDKPTEFTIVLAEVPFSTGRGSKVRPFLIWRDCGWDFWGFPLTGHTPRGKFEIALNEWWLANLQSPGTVRVASGCPVAKQRVGRVIGRVSRVDAEKIADVVATLFAVKGNEPSIEQELDLAFA